MTYSDLTSLVGFDLSFAEKDSLSLVKNNSRLGLLLPIEGKFIAMA
jgi:hypothetical protein